MHEFLKLVNITNDNTSGSALIGKHVAVLDEIVERCYEIFSRYTVSGNLDTCTDMCCLSPEEVQQLLKPPLKSIHSGILQSWNHAAKTKNPNLDEFKHFLPRILDVIADYNVPSHSVELGLMSFEYYSKDDWTSEEWDILTKYLDAFFDQMLNAFPLPNHTMIEELLVMVDKAGFDISPYLLKWEKSQCDQAVFHFCKCAVFRIQFGSEYKYSNGFASEEFIRVFSNWLDKDGLLSEFMGKIETLILSDEPIDQVTMESLNQTYEILSMLGYGK